MRSNMFHSQDRPIQLLIDESTTQYFKSRLRANVLEAFAYLTGILMLASAVVTLAFGIRDEDRDTILMSIPIFLAAIVSFVVISAFAHLLGNSAHQLRLMAYDFYLSHDDDDYPTR